MAEDPAAAADQGQEGSQHEGEAPEQVQASAGDDAGGKKRERFSEDGSEPYAKRKNTNVSLCAGRGRCGP